MEEKTETKYNPGKQEPVYNLVDENMVKDIINFANCFGMSPEARKSMFEANEATLKDGVE